MLMTLGTLKLRSRGSAIAVPLVKLGRSAYVPENDDTPTYATLVKQLTTYATRLPKPKIVRRYFLATEEELDALRKSLETKGR
jgi:hypothetical protein